MIPHGLYIWHTEKIRTDHIAALKKQHCSRVYLKTLDDASAGIFWPQQCNTAAIKKFNDAGIEVVGWGYVFDKRTSTNVAGITEAVRKSIEAGCIGFIVDIESEAENTATHAQIKELMESIRKVVPIGQLGYTSFGNPESHPNVPWKTLHDICDYQCPQMYYKLWTFATNEQEVIQAFAQHKKFGIDKKPIYPIFTAENNADPKELQVFLNKYPGSSIYAAQCPTSWDIDYRGAIPIPTPVPAPQEPTGKDIERWVLNSNDASDARGYNAAGKCVCYMETGGNFEMLYRGALAAEASQAPFTISSLAKKPMPTPAPTSTIVSHSWKNGGDDTKAPTITRLPDGRFIITSDADCDADGSPRATTIDPHYGQVETSLRRSNGWKGTYQYCDSEKIPFFVLPLNWTKVTGDTKSQLGDVAKLTYKDKFVYAIYADAGPATLIGETSVCAMEQLGFNPWNDGRTEVTKGMPHGVTYEVVSGSVNLNRTVDFDSIQAYGRELFEGIIQPVPEPDPTPNPVEPDPIPTDNNAKKFIEFFEHNYDKVRAKVNEWFTGVYSPTAVSNGCVAHQYSALFLCGLPVPKQGSMESINVDYFFAWALKNGWSKVTDMAKLQPGDICISGPSSSNFDHVYAFHSYKTPEIAYALHNQKVGLCERALINGSCGRWRFAIRMA